jgi:hypothetical protein
LLHKFVCRANHGPVAVNIDIGKGNLEAGIHNMMPVLCLVIVVVVVVFQRKDNCTALEFGKWIRNAT